MLTNDIIKAQSKPFVSDVYQTYCL